MAEVLDTGKVDSVIPLLTEHSVNLKKKKNVFLLQVPVGLRYFFVKPFLKVVLRLLWRQVLAKMLVPNQGELLKLLPKFPRGMTS